VARDLRRAGSSRPGEHACLDEFARVGPACLDGGVKHCARSLVRRLLWRAARRAWLRPVAGSLE
jgi:hypothetical protein